MKKITFLFTLFLVLFSSCNQSNEAKGDKSVRNGEREEAIQYYILALGEDSENTELMNKLALAYSNNHQPDKATEVYVTSAESGDEYALKMLGAISFKNADYLVAIEYYKPLADSGNTDVIYDLGSSYYNVGQYDEALKYLLSGKQSVYEKNIIGKVYYAMKDYENAEKYWKSAVDDYPSGGVNSYNSLLELYKEQGRTEDFNKYKGRY